MTFGSDKDVISAVQDVLNEIPIEMICRVMDDWVGRLKRVIELGGDYLT
jgi:hypothetical protein